MLAGLSQSRGVVKKAEVAEVAEVLGMQGFQELSRRQDGEKVDNYLVKFGSSGGMLEAYIALEFYVYVLLLNLQV
jgi:hypothetical protein